jgi:hypothetical protein
VLLAVDDAGADDDAVVVDGGRGDQDPGGAGLFDQQVEVVDPAVFPHEGVLGGGVDEGVADDDAGVVDSGGEGGVVGDEATQGFHDAVGVVEERVGGAEHGGGDADDLAFLVDGVGFAVGVVGEGAEASQLAVLVDEGVVADAFAGVGRRRESGEADDLALVVDGRSAGEVAAEGAQVGHLTVAVEDGALGGSAGGDGDELVGDADHVAGGVGAEEDTGGAVEGSDVVEAVTLDGGVVEVAVEVAAGGDLGVADDESGVVDGVCEGIAAEGAQGVHDAVGVEEGADVGVAGGGGGADDVAVVVDGAGLAGRAAEGSEVGDAVEGGCGGGEGGEESEEGGEARGADGHVLSPGCDLICG